MIATRELQLHLRKPQYYYNFRHLKSVWHLKFHPSDNHKATVISGFLKSVSHLKFHLPAEHCVHNYKRLWNQMQALLTPFTFVIENSNRVDQMMPVQQVNSSFAMCCCLWVWLLQPMGEHFGFWQCWSNGCFLVKIVKSLPSDDFHISSFHQFSFFVIPWSFPVFNFLHIFDKNMNPCRLCLCFNKEFTNLCHIKSYFIILS